MLEFALLTPLMLMIGMFVIEMLQYHDAAIMADHTAWRIARMASVRTDLKGKVSLPKWKKYESDKFAAVLLMSTVTTGWGVEGKLIADGIGNAFKSDKSKSDLNTGSAIIDGILNGLGIVNKIQSWIDQTIGGKMWGRYPVLMAKAYSRLCEKDVLKVKTEKIGELSYPVITTDKNKEAKMVAGYMVIVTLDYPMRGGWFYRYFSLDGKEQLNTRPAVHGRAMMLSEARIEDTKVYDADPKSRGGVFSVVGNLIKKLNSFTKIKEDGEKKEIKKAKELRKKVDDLNAEIAGKKVELAQKEAQLKILRDERDAAKSSLDELETQKKQLESQKAELEARLWRNKDDTAAKTELETVKKMLDNVRKDINKKKDIISKKNAEISGPKSEEAKLKKYISTKEAELAKTKAKGDEYMKKYEKEFKMAKEISKADKK